MASRRSRMSDRRPDACEECAGNVPKDRREDYGDVCMRWCRERRTWLDFHSEPPCGGKSFSEEVEER